MYSQIKSQMEPALEAKIREVIEPLEGWCWPEKALAMAQLILDTKPQTVVEIGVFGGRSLIPQALALKELGSGIVYGIDPWRRDDTLEGTLSRADLEWWGKLDLEAIHAGCMKAIWESGVSDQCVIIRSSSQKCPKLFGGGIQVLHVDGTHSEEVSTRDIRLYLPQVSEGGHVFMDDSDWPTTARAVAMLELECDKIEVFNRPGGGGSCALYRRR